MEREEVEVPHKVKAAGVSGQTGLESIKVGVSVSVSQPERSQSGGFFRASGAVGTGCQWLTQLNWKERTATWKSPCGFAPLRHVSQETRTLRPEQIQGNPRIRQSHCGLARRACVPDTF